MSTISVLQRIGLIADEMTAPRQVAGYARHLISLVAVGFSGFFMYISYFGPPPTEIFKGVFILGVTLLTLLLYRYRLRPLSERVIWLDELFSLLAVAATCAFLAIWAYWGLFDGRELWSEFVSTSVVTVAIAGIIVGLVLYAWEARRPAASQAFVLVDGLFVLCAIAPVAWWGINQEEIVSRIGSPITVETVVFSGMLTAVSFEIARRVVGPVIPLIGLLFLVYCFKPVAQASPGLFEHVGYDFSQVFEFLMLATDGMTGLIIDVFATYVVIFVIVGAFLEKTGLGELFIDATYRMTGRRTGGPGLAAVMSSGLFGMISGSGVANVVTTGTFTIPLMKRVGYRPEFAGAVEAAASTGGAYMPPIMGAGAFLLAQLTEISYFEVIKIALIPALLYYLAVALAVYLRAVKVGLKGVPVEELPAWAKIVPRLHLLLPIPVMIYFLVIGDSAFLAAIKTIILIVMLKFADLLVAIPTSWSHRTNLPFVLLAAAFGLFVYQFGLQIGGPFTFEADLHRGLNFGSAIFWGAGAFIVLKVLEILLAGLTSPAAAATARDQHGPSEHRDLFIALLEAIGQLVKIVFQAMEAGARNTLVIGCIAGVLGVLLSCATQSDLPGRISSLLVDLSFGMLPLTIFWVIVAGYIVGMGLPIVASYVVLVVFGVGALTDQGVPTLAAHLICYWVAVVSAVTPPVALAAYAASAIATSDPVKTGVEALKLASMILIMPFLFVYTPLLLDGSALAITLTVVACVLGVIAWTSFLERYMLGATPTPQWLMLGGAAACLLFPLDHLIAYLLGWPGELQYHVYAVGALLLALVFVIQRGRRVVT